jgi:hypothetical protein
MDCRLMIQEHKSNLLAYQADAAAKLAALPGRLKAEAEQAQKERRRPFNIAPLTEVDPASLSAALAAITDPPKDLAECVGSLTAVCQNQTDPFAMRCDQLVEVLKLAGVKGD